MPTHTSVFTSVNLPGLNPRPGRVFELEIRRKFGTSITPDSPHSRPFLLVVSFGRCRFRLSPQSVSLILQAVIGGLPQFIRVSASRIVSFASQFLLQM